MAPIRSFEDLEVWKKSRQMDKMIYALTKSNLLSRDFVLRDQMLKSSGSTMDNIAEGFERDGNREFVQFLSISKGSCGELRSQLIRANDRAYITQTEFDLAYAQTVEIGKMLQGLMSYLRTSELRGTKFIKTNN